MQTYLNLLKEIRDTGVQKGDRTGTGTKSVFGRQLHIDLERGFPLLTTKKMYLPAIIHELIWIISGSDKTTYLKENNVKIWDVWAHHLTDSVGPLYGKQLRAWNTSYNGQIDQLANIIELIKNDPDSRRIGMTTWNVGELDQMALYPCHGVFIQFYVAEGKLSCCMTQRSADAFLGVPFNIASYAILTHMVAQVCDLDVGHLVMNFGDLHIYNNHFNAVNEQLENSPLGLPKLVLNPKIKDIDTFTFDDVKVVGYKHAQVIKAPISV